MQIKHLIYNAIFTYTYNAYFHESLVPHESPKPMHHHVQLPKEHELYRVFDSLVFEDEDVHTREEGIDTSGQLNPDQTKDLL